LGSDSGSGRRIDSWSDAVRVSVLIMADAVRALFLRKVRNSLERLGAGEGGCSVMEDWSGKARSDAPCFQNRRRGYLG
jgi:hypothetical protein